MADTQGSDDGRVVIKKYANRRLYNTASSSYVTLEHLSDMVKQGVILIDVGVSRVVDPVTGKARVVGDIAVEAREKASWYSPNPGGVGPMTRAMLLANVVESAERQGTTAALTGMHIVETV